MNRYDETTRRPLLSHIVGGKYDGSSLENGLPYHSFFGLRVRSHRGDVGPRAEQILDNIDVAGLQGVDLGCNIGGITFSMERAGASMTGVDYDEGAIHIARVVGDELGSSAKFTAASISPQNLLGFCRGRQLVVWLAQWMWFVRQHGKEQGIEALRRISKETQILVFESSFGDGMAGPLMRQLGITKPLVKEIISDHFDLVRDLGRSHDGWHRREIIIAARGKGLSRVKTAPAE